MKLKLDENLGARGEDLFRHAGHDVITVSEQDLCSATDVKLSEVCRIEKRCLVTLDLDFGNPLIYNPANYSGIAVIRLPPTPTPDDLFDTINTLIIGLSRKEIKGQLWIIQRGFVNTNQKRRTKSEKEGYHANLGSDQHFTPP